MSCSQRQILSLALDPVAPLLIFVPLGAIKASKVAVRRTLAFLGRCWQRVQVPKADELETTLSYSRLLAGTEGPLEASGLTGSPHWPAGSQDSAASLQFRWQRVYLDVQGLNVVAVVLEGS